MNNALLKRDGGLNAVSRRERERMNDTNKGMRSIYVYSTSTEVWWCPHVIDTIHGEACKCEVVAQM